MVSKPRPHYLVYSSSGDWLFLAAGKETADFDVISSEHDLNSKLQSTKELLHGQIGKQKKVVLLIDSTDCLVVHSKPLTRGKNKSQYHFALEERVPIDAEVMQTGQFLITSDIDVVIDTGELRQLANLIAECEMNVTLVAPIVTFLLQSASVKPTDNRFTVKLLNGVNEIEFRKKELVDWQWHSVVGNSTRFAGLESPDLTSGDRDQPALTNPSETTQNLELSVNGLVGVSFGNSISRPWISFQGLDAISSENYFQRMAMIVSITLVILFAIVNFFLWNTGNQYYRAGRRNIATQNKLASAVSGSKRKRVDVEGFLRKRLNSLQENQPVIDSLKSRNRISDLAIVLESVVEHDSFSIEQIGLENGLVKLIGSADKKTVLDAASDRLTELGFIISNGEKPLPSTNRLGFSWLLRRKESS